MKKLSMLCLGLVSIMLVTGCGSSNSKTLVCKNTQKQDGVDIGTTVSMTFKNEKINRVKMDVSTRLTGDDAKDLWSTFVEAMDGQNEEVDKDGVSMKVSKDDKKYEYTVTLDVNLDKADKDALATYGLDDLIGDDSKLEDVKKEAEKDDFTCEVK